MQKKWLGSCFCLLNLRQSFINSCIVSFRHVPLKSRLCPYTILIQYAPKGSLSNVPANERNKIHRSRSLQILILCLTFQGGSFVRAVACWFIWTGVDVQSTFSLSLSHLHTITRTRSGSDLIIGGNLVFSVILKDAQHREPAIEKPIM